MLKESRRVELIEYHLESLLELLKPSEMEMTAISYYPPHLTYHINQYAIELLNHLKR